MALWTQVICKAKYCLVKVKNMSRRGLWYPVREYNTSNYLSFNDFWTNLDKNKCSGCQPNWRFAVEIKERNKKYKYFKEDGGKTIIEIKLSEVLQFYDNDVYSEIWTHFAINNTGLVKIRVFIVEICIPKWIYIREGKYLRKTCD